jgi:hypothetical protein
MLLLNKIKDILMSNSLRLSSLLWAITFSCASMASIDVPVLSMISPGNKTVQTVDSPVELLVTLKNYTKPVEFSLCGERFVRASSTIINQLKWTPRKESVVCEIYARVPNSTGDGWIVSPSVYIKIVAKH